MPTTPEKTAIAAPQQSQGGEVAKFKQSLMGLFQNTGVQPQAVIQLGDMARAAIKDKALWPMFKDAVIRSGIANANEIKPNIDYQMLSYFAVAAKMLKGAA